MLLATVLPTSRTEQRVVEEAKPQLQEAAEQLKEAGRSVAAEAKDHAREAVDEVKAVGSDATSNVKEQAESSAKQVKDDAAPLKLADVAGPQPVPAASSRSTRRRIFPEADLGIASTKLTLRICL